MALQNTCIYKDDVDFYMKYGQIHKFIIFLNKFIILYNYGCSLFFMSFFFHL